MLLKLLNIYKKPVNSCFCAVNIVKSMGQISFKSFKNYVTFFTKCNLLICQQLVTHKVSLLNNSFKQEVPLLGSCFWEQKSNFLFFSSFILANHYFFLTIYENKIATGPAIHRCSHPPELF